MNLSAPAINEGQALSASPAVSTSSEHATLVTVGAELLAVVAMVVIAGTSPAAMHVMVALLIALWVLFLIGHGSSMHVNFAP